MNNSEANNNKNCPINFDKIHRVHFIGIGGISMSGLAEILLGEGFTISGSDSKESNLTKQLAEKGIKTINKNRRL